MWRLHHEVPPLILPEISPLIHPNTSPVIQPKASSLILPEASPLVHNEASPVIHTEASPLILRSSVERGRGLGGRGKEGATFHALFLTDKVTLMSIENSISVFHIPSYQHEVFLFFSCILPNLWGLLVV